MLTVQQLLEILQECDKSKVVVFDGGGLACPITVVYSKNWAYNESGRIVLPIELTPELEEQFFDERDLDDGTGLPCILLTDDEL